MITGDEILRAVLSKNLKFARPIYYQQRVDFPANAAGLVRTANFSFKENAAFLLMGVVINSYIDVDTINAQTSNSGAISISFKRGPTGETISQLPERVAFYGTRLNGATEFPQYTLFENNEDLYTTLTTSLNIAQTRTLFINAFGVEYRG